jgi:signal transduction histidine kinase
VVLNVSMAEGLPAIPMSRQDIESALINIATNALQASPPRGQVLIEATAESRAGIPGVAFTIRDTGPGIDADLLPHIFDPFFTTKPAGQGTGLGLSIAHQAVAAHTGRLEVDSKPGAGTTMRVWLPVEPDAEPGPGPGSG